MNRAVNRPDTASNRRIFRKGPAKGASVFLGLAALGFAAACTATADTRAPAQPVVCEIALDAIPGGTRVRGIVTADNPTVGTYDMQIRSSSASIRQAGDFVARPGQPVTIAETDLVGAASGQRVDLQIRYGSQQMSCAAPRL